MRGEQISDLLRTCRERAKLSQDELARRLHIDQAIVSKVENGKIIPSYVLVKQWGKATKSEDLISMDLTGEKSLNMLTQIEERFNKIRELVSFMRIKKAK